MTAKQKGFASEVSYRAEHVVRIRVDSLSGLWIWQPAWLLRSGTITASLKTQLIDRIHSLIRGSQND